MNKNTNLTNLQRKLAFWTRLDNLASLVLVVVSMVYALTHSGIVAVLAGVLAGFIACSLVYHLWILPKAYKALDKR